MLSEAEPKKQLCDVTITIILVVAYEEVDLVHAAVPVLGPQVPVQFQNLRIPVPYSLRQLCFGRAVAVGFGNEGVTETVNGSIGEADLTLRRRKLILERFDHTPL